jgi:hypothetical protein
MLPLALVPCFPRFPFHMCPALHAPLVLSAPGTERSFREVSFFFFWGKFPRSFVASYPSSFTISWIIYKEAIVACVAEELCCHSFQKETRRRLLKFCRRWDDGIVFLDPAPHPLLSASVFTHTIFASLCRTLWGWWLERDNWKMIASLQLRSVNMYHRLKFNLVWENRIQTKPVDWSDVFRWWYYRFIKRAIHVP